MLGYGNEKKQHLCNVCITITNKYQVIQQIRQPLQKHLLQFHQIYRDSKE